MLVFSHLKERHTELFTDLAYLTDLLLLVNKDDDRFFIFVSLDYVLDP